MKNLFFLTCASLFFSSQIAAQDPKFLNTNQSLIYLNPSFAGSNGGVRVQSSYRNQWPLLSGRFVTYVSSVDMYVKPLKAGIALSCMTDDAAYGLLKTTAFDISYAQHLTCCEHLKIIPSVHFSYRQKDLDVDQLYYGSVMDPRRGFVWNTPSAMPVPRKTSASVSGGFLVNVCKNFYAGAYVFQINQPDEGLLGAYRLPARFLFHASYNMHISDDTHLQFFYRSEMQNRFLTTQLSINAVFHEHLITGLGYTSGSTPMINLGYRHNYFAIQLGYDATFSKLAGNTSGSWELHTSFNLRDKENRKVFTNFESW